MEVIIKIGILFVIVASLIAFAVMLFALPVALYRRRKILDPRLEGKNYFEKTLISVKYDFTEKVLPWRNNLANSVSRLRSVFAFILIIILVIGGVIYGPELAINS